MTLEALGAWAIKLAWSPFVAYFLWLKKKDKDKLDDTFTKTETTDLIDLKLIAVQQEFSLKNQAMTDKIDNLAQMIMAGNNRESEQRDYSNSLLQTLTVDMQKMNTDVQVLSVEFKNVKEDVSELKRDIRTLSER